MLTPDRAGQITISGPRKTREADTLTCAHCQRVMVIRSSSPELPPYVGETCRKCMKKICPLCMGKDCEPFIKKIERMEARDRLLRSISDG